MNKSHPQIFRELTEKFGDLLELAPAQRICKSTEDDIPKELIKIAEKLILLKAGANDVIKLYKTALGKRSESSIIIKGEVYAEEGRLMLIELLTFLLTYYQRSYLKKVF